MVLFTAVGGRVLRRPQDSQLFGHLFSAAVRAPVDMIGALSQGMLRQQGSPHQVRSHQPSESGFLLVRRGAF